MSKKLDKKKSIECTKCGRLLFTLEFEGINPVKIIQFECPSFGTRIIDL